jgi:formate/nitrite transporter FocA (FNT family)
MGDERAEIDPNEVDESSHLRPATVYEVIRKEGAGELRRPLKSLFWSGVAAGLSLSLSVYAQAFLLHRLPDTEWRPLVVGLGYPIGFLIVIFGRLQLFTENTITVILPLLAERTWDNFYQVVRLWSVVFATNLIGTFVSAALLVYLKLAGGEHLEAALEVSRSFAEKAPLEMFLLGILAGFFVAALVWTLPDAKGSEFWLIIAITYVMAIGEFAHVIVGSAEVFLLFLNGELSALQTAGAYILPAFIGNVVGGGGLFAILAYAQVSEEI